MRPNPSTAANLANLPRSFVGVSLLAIAVVQPQVLWLTCRHRQQAGSHRLIAFQVKQPSETQRILNHHINPVNIIPGLRLIRSMGDVRQLQ